MKVVSRHLWGHGLVWEQGQGGFGCEEALLAHMGLTEPAARAFVEECGAGWRWSVVDTFDAGVLVGGSEPTRDAAKRAVTGWVHDHLAGV